ncbi:MAG: hypothetical protein QW687_04880 [Candidatus Hadarchaeales archaeon]
MPIKKDLGRRPPLPRPKTKMEFVNMCWNLFRLLPPTAAVCEGHSAPLDIVWSIYNQEKSNYVIVGSRGSGKTTCVALLQVLFSLTFPEIEVCNTAAILRQAQRCYEIVKNLLFHPKGKIGMKVIPPYVDEKWSTMWQTRVATGSTIFITSLTEKGVNAPHPQKLFVDEVDLVDNKKPLEEALSMPQTKGDAIRQIVFLSSWKRKGGLISMLIDNYKNDPASAIAFWCVFEAMSPIPDHSVCQSVVRKLADGTEVSFADICKGKAHKAKGFLNYQDVLRAFLDMDEHYFRSQWLSEEPLGGLNVFNVNPKSVIQSWDPTKFRGCPIFAGVDYGWSAPTAIVIAQVIPKVGVVVFEEHGMLGASVSQVAHYCLEIEKKFRQRGLHITTWVIDPRAHHLLSDEFSKRYLMTAAPFPDKGVLTPAKHEKLSRVSLVNNLFTADFETGLPRIFFVQGKVPTLLKQLYDLSYAVDSEGNPTDKIPDGNDDFVDALLYLVSYLDKLGYGEVLGDVVNPDEVAARAYEEIQRQLDLSKDNEFGVSPEELTGDENEQRELLRELIRERLSKVISLAAASGILPPSQNVELEEELVRVTEDKLLSEMTAKEATERLVNDNLPPEVERQLIKETVRKLDRLAISPLSVPYSSVFPEAAIYDLMMFYLLGGDEGNPFLPPGGLSPFGGF